MDQIIHKDAKTAREACEKYEEEVSKLQDTLGVDFVESDTCADSWTTAEYYDADGKQRTYYLWNHKLTAQ